MTTSALYTGSITPAMLQALLSPDDAQRSAMESVLYGSKQGGGWTVEQRCLGWLQVLSSSTSSSPDATALPPLPRHLFQLAAVLLRRDIIHLPNINTNNTASRLVEPLLQILSDHQHSLEGAPTATAIAPATATAIAPLYHCLAEICACLNWQRPDSVDASSTTNNNNSTGSGSSVAVATVQRILSSFPTAVPLWMAVADRAPQAFCASAAWQQLPIGMVQQQQQSIMGNSSTGSGASSSKDVSSSELALLVAAATAVDRHSSGIPNVQTAIYALGDGYFVPMVPQFLQLIRQTIQDAANNNNDDDDSSMLTLWELLIEATEDVPNLLCGTENCLSAILEICHVQLSSTACNNSNTNSNGNLLSAVRLVALVCQIPSVKVVAAAASRSTAGLSLQQKVDQLHKLAVIACWNTMIQEPQGDEDYLLNLQGWAFEPVSLYDDDENSDDEDDAEFYHAQALLSELLRSSAPQKTLEVLLPTVEQAFAAVTPPASQQQCLYTRSSERLHCAALCALQCCLESIPVAFAAHRPVTLQAAVHAASVQSNARVQFHALRLLGVLGETCVVPDTDIAPTSSGDVACLPDSSRMILQQLTQATNHGCTKIAAMACQALVSFCRPIVKAESASTESERSSASALAPFLSDVLQALVRGPLSLDLNRLGSAVVQVRATGVVACFAQLAGASSFAPYYSSVMPSLLSRTNMATGGKDENLQLAGASLEAATMIGQAVGIDLFRTDAHQIMQWIVSTQMLQQSQEPSIPMDLVLSACARIASVLGPDYVPYMDAVLPKLLHFATDPSDVEFSEGEVSGLDESKRQRSKWNETGNESMTVAIPGRGLTRVTINTTKIQEKSQASRAVYEHAVAMGASFGPYCQVCLDAFLPLVAFRFSSDIRYTAAQTVASVFDAACSYGESAGWETPTAYLSLVLTSVARQVPDEDVANMEAVYGLANSLCDSCRSMHLYAEDFGSELIGILPVSEARVIVQYCMTAIVSCLERRSHLASVLAEGPINGDDEKNELVGHLQREEDLLTPLVDSVGYIMKCFGSKFVAIFEENVAVKLGNFLTSGPDVRARLSAVCLFDDCIEHCGSEAAAKFGPPLVEGILNGIHQGNMEYDGELQRAAIYGISQLARYAPPTVLAPQAQHFAQYLCGLLTDTKEESDDVVVYENASSALASLMLFPNAPFQNSGFVKRETLESSFINSLPIREDEDEAKVCHDGLCDLVEHGRINVDSSTLARILQEILADVEDGDEIASAETCNRMRTILLRLQQNQSNGNSHDSFCFANIVSP